MDTPTSVGGPQNSRCPRCGNIARTNARFCGKCGEQLRSLPGQHTGSGSIPSTQAILEPVSGTAFHMASQAPGNPLSREEDVSEMAASHQQAQVGRASTKGAGTKEQQREDPLAIFDKIVLAQTLLVALLLATQSLPQPSMSSGVFTQSGIAYEVPLVSFFVLIVSLALGYWFALAGALHSHWSVCFPVITLSTGILAVQPLTVLIGNGVRHDLFTAEIWLSLAQLGILAVFWLWALRILLRRNRGQTSADSQTSSWHGRTLRGVLVLLLIYYGLGFVIWLSLVHAGQVSTGGNFFFVAIGGQVLLLPIVLVIPILSFGTDLLDRGQKLVKLFIFTRKGDIRFPRLLPGLTALVAVGMIIIALFQGGSGFIPGLVIVIVLAGIVALFVRYMRGDVHWSVEISPIWFFLGATFIFVDTVLLVDINIFSVGLTSLVVTTLSMLLRVPIALGMLTIALFLVAHGRMGKHQLGVGGLFLALVVLLVLAVTIPSALTTAGFSVPQPYNYLKPMIVCAAGGTLIWMLYISVQRRWKEATLPLATTFLMLVGLQIVVWGYALLQLSAKLGENSVVLLAAFFLLLPLWDALTPILKGHLTPILRVHAPKLWDFISTDSNKQETNDDNSLFSTTGSRLLLTGYTLVGSALLLYLGTLREPIPGAVSPTYLQNDLTDSSGLLLLGVPLVVLGFILGIARLRHKTSISPAKRISQQAKQRAIIGSGVLVTVVVTILLLVTALPRQIGISENQQYTAAIPGPDCDTGGATWSVTPSEPISTSCLKTGLQVKIQAKSIGRINFIPPSGVFTQNYRVSVQVDLNHLSNGCVSTDTRFSSAGYYWNHICSKGRWGIDRMTSSGDIPLAANILEQATTYTIGATVDGANQRLAIDGMQVGSVSDATLPTTVNVNLEILNLSSNTGSVVFSNFVFTPLPALPPASSQPSYRASSPGVVCDKGGAQWALMTLLEAKVECQPNGTQLEVQARNEGLMAFTPPSGIFPQKYQISVQVNLRALGGGCAFIEDRVSYGYFFRYALCSSGIWEIALYNGRQSSPLASGIVSPAAMYTLGATTNGPNRRLAVNGIEMGSVAYVARSTTAFIDLAAYNPNNKIGTAVFSNFVFTPLP